MAVLPADGVGFVSDLAPGLVDGEVAEKGAGLPAHHIVGSEFEPVGLFGEKPGGGCLCGNITGLAIEHRLIVAGVFGAAWTNLGCGRFGDPLHRSQHSLNGRADPLCKLG
jgi:hypothetical protein